MSLDTVLHIGRTLRQSKNSLKYVSYIVKCPKNKKGEFPFCISIPINSDWSINWDGVHETPENEREMLYYLKYKTTSSDNQVKYIFGDIYYEVKPNIDKSGRFRGRNEDGYYRIIKDSENDSFQRGNVDATEIIKGGCETLKKFRHAIHNDLSLLKNILKYPNAIQYTIAKGMTDLKELISDEDNIRQCSLAEIKSRYGENNLAKTGLTTSEEYLQLGKGSIFIHFEFPLQQHWYDMKEVVESISKKILDEYIQKANQRIVLNKSLYKALSSGQEDLQTPDFKLSNRYKSKSFTEEEVLDLFYAIDMAGSKLATLLPNTNIKYIILPKGENLSEEDYTLFSEHKSEINILVANSGDFDDFDNGQITTFDVVFSRNGGKSPDTDLVEISNIEKSKILQIKERINHICNSVKTEYNKGGENSNTEFSPSSCFKRILGIPSTNNEFIEYKTDPNYSKHILNVLPRIYQGSYYNDDKLFPSFIRNVEYTIRAGCSQYSVLKYSVKLLLDIQNNQTSEYMEIINNENYKAGLGLGELAKPLGRKINSFQKNYVGLITRRASSKDECIALVNDIIEKLVMHECSYQTGLCGNVCKEIAELENFDKEIFAFGFFEGYFKYVANDSKENFILRAEKLLTDFSGKEDVMDTCTIINEAINNLKK